MNATCIGPASRSSRSAACRPVADRACEPRPEAVGPHHDSMPSFVVQSSQTSSIGASYVRSIVIVFARCGALIRSRSSCQFSFALSRALASCVRVPVAKRSRRRSHSSRYEASPTRRARGTARGAASRSAAAPSGRTAHEAGLLQDAQVARYAGLVDVRRARRCRSPRARRPRSASTMLPSRRDPPGSGRRLHCISMYMHISAYDICQPPDRAANCRHALADASDDRRVRLHVVQPTRLRRHRRDARARLPRARSRRCRRRRTATSRRPGRRARRAA